MRELEKQLKEEEKISSDPNETREAFITRIAAEGYIPTYLAPDELFLDIDNEQHLAVFERSWEILLRNFQNLGLGVVPETDPMDDITPGMQDISYRKTPSRSGKGWHIRIRMPFNMSDDERIAWQASLGSDPVRELLSCIRFRVGDVKPTMLVETKDFK